MPEPARKPPKRNVVPDRLDLRDRPYLPAIAVEPATQMRPKIPLPVLDQDDTNACTGFALANVVNFLLRHRDPAAPPISPFMIYSMARRYDEFPGSTEDAGSSLRGAMKGWYRHGACRFDLWEKLDMPPAAGRPQDDWWLDAAKRPLGAYYRVDTRSVTDMHVALSEVGILYASAVCHNGWLKGDGARSPKGGYWTIPARKARPNDGGHAFVIVGYNREGFVLQNSWGGRWGTRGLAVIAYEDWLENAMDCWVAQLGVATEQHLEIAGSLSLRVEKRKVKIAADVILRDREISPFIINMENNGRLSTTGRFRTQPGDVQALVTMHLDAARKSWGLARNTPADVAIYAHGGLTSEEDAAKTAAKWIPALYEAKIFPIFLMWETDLWSTLKNRLADLISGQPRPTAGIGEQLKRFWNQRLERLLAGPGSLIWGEMKQNADAISSGRESGGRILYECAKQSPVFAAAPVRLHLIGHSAGSIAHSRIVERLCGLGWTFESLSLMAPAVTVDLFRQTVLPRLRDGKVKRLNEFHLTDVTEQADPTCQPILFYSRSLLYLVSESFENGVRTPILGMEKYFNTHVGRLGLRNVQAWSSPLAAGQSTTHGGFDDDRATRESVISLIRTGKLLKA
ncbi:MAG: C1 family peptidase [Betaproteobacteria bacterium]|nr:C1 family peptidase [Betaproteobacteria bacterium]